MKFLLLTVVAVFGISFVHMPTLGAGWFWDAGNALGFAAFAGLLGLTMPAHRRFELKAHTLLGYVVLALAMLHALWFLVGDSVVAEYLKPGAPLLMWLGLLGLLLLGVSICLSVVPDRFRVHRNYASFKSWHVVLAIVTLLASFGHVVMNGFYVGSTLQVVLLGLLSVIVLWRRQELRGLMRSKQVPALAFAVVALIACVAFVLVRNQPW